MVLLQPTTHFFMAQHESHVPAHYTQEWQEQAQQLTQASMNLTGFMNVGVLEE